MYSSRTVGFVALGLGLLASCAAVAGPMATATPDGAGQRQAKPDVRSHAFYVLDGKDLSVLAARHESVAVPIASITKLMTALVVLEAEQSIDEILTITSDEVRGTVGSGSRLAPGVKLSRGDMLHLALMSSENRAAYALCRHYPGGMDACVQAMNDRAAALGMSTAHFVEPTGLSSRNVASARDLATLVLAASANPTIREYSTDSDHTVYVNRRRLDYRNTNLLVDKPDWQVSVQKTGYISEAGRCLVMEAVIDERQVVIVLLNSSGSLTRIADARRIRAWLESRQQTVASHSPSAPPVG